MGILGVLVALAITALAGARAASREAVCLANLRGIAQVMALYTERHAGKYPFARAGDPIDLSPEGNGQSTLTYSNHFELRTYWAGLMHTTIEWRGAFPAWLCPGAPRRIGEPWISEPDGEIGVPSYRYTSGFIADPRVWSGSAIADSALLRAVASHEVRFPAGKTLMWDQERAHLRAKDDRDPTPQALADGHAAVKRVSAASAPVANPFTGFARPLLDTPNGVLGRDY